MVNRRLLKTGIPYRERFFIYFFGLKRVWERLSRLFLTAFWFWLEFQKSVSRFWFVFILFDHEVCVDATISLSFYWLSILIWVTIYVCAKTLFRWATGKRLTNRLPKLSLKHSPHGTDWIYGSTCHQQVVPINGDPEVFFRLLTWRNSLLFEKAFLWWAWASKSWPTTHCLSTTP